MTNTEETIPPRKPNTLRTWLPRLWSFIARHKDYTIPLGVGIAGVIVGAWIF